MGDKKVRHFSRLSRPCWLSLIADWTCLQVGAEVIKTKAGARDLLTAVDAELIGNYAIRIKFSDPSVCRPMLLGLDCPHTLFRNTKSDLGPCPAQLCDPQMVSE